MDQDALDRLIATIDELEHLFAQAKDDPKSPAWREMQQRIAELQEQLEQLNPPH
jgi:DNA repair exonuclease SbcCD ATPase subunit